MYEAGIFNEVGATGIILWSNAPEKIITVEIAEYARYAKDTAKIADIAKIVIRCYHQLIRVAWKEGSSRGLPFF